MRIIQIILLWALWSGCIFLVPESTYWRDSGEFIIQAFALDITHPAGFPLYGMVANLFTLLPFGPIPWRVILLSALSLTLLVCSISLLVREVLARTHATSALNITLATSLATLLTASALPLVLKQAFSAEVYLLNSLMLLLVSALTLRGLNRQDFHALATAAFIGGISIGNHISSAVIGVEFALLLLVFSPFARRSLIKLTLFSLLGMLVYAYLPLRASSPVTLNTGKPNSVERFWNVVSDARDRQLRSAVDEEPAAFDLAGLNNLFANPLQNLRQDLKKLSIPQTLPALATTLLLVGLLLFLRPLATLLLSAVAVGNYCFFAGWDGDPWIPAVAAISTLLVCALFHLTALLPDEGRRSAPLVASLLIALLLANFPLQTTLAELRYLREYDTPARFTEAWLSSSSAPVAIVENSWFLARYLADIEGVADEKHILYQPSILFPAHFFPAHLRFSDGFELDSEDDRTLRGIAATDPAFATLGFFVDTISQRTRLMIEPGLLLNTTLHPVMRLSRLGTAEISRGSQQESASLSAEALASRYAPLVQEAMTAPSWIRGDVRNYLENILNNQIDLLKKQHQENLAANMLKTICLPIESDKCSLVSLNHLGLLYLKTENYAEAAALYNTLLRQDTGSRETLERNLALANKGLEQKQP